MIVRIYPDWFTDGRLRWSIDRGDHREQTRVDVVTFTGLSGVTQVDPRWTREEAREQDAPKCWLEVTAKAVDLIRVDGLLVARLG